MSLENIPPSNSSTDMPVSGLGADAGQDLHFIPLLQPPSQEAGLNKIGQAQMTYNQAVNDIQKGDLYTAHQLLKEARTQNPELENMPGVTLDQLLYQTSWLARNRGKVALTAGAAGALTTLAFTGPEAIANGVAIAEFVEGALAFGSLAGSAAYVGATRASGMQPSFKTYLDGAADGALGVATVHGLTAVPEGTQADAG